MGAWVKAVYRTDHPDCLPLGDIAGTLALLLKTNPEIRFRVLYRLDDDEFRFDSDELKQLGIDLDTAEMFLHSKNFLLPISRNYFENDLAAVTFVRSAI